MIRYSVPNASQDYRGDDGSVQGADAVDDTPGIGNRVDDLWVGCGSDLLAVGINVPNAGDAGG